MPTFSAFTPFGHLAFSAKPAHGQKLYLDMLRNYGAAENFAESGSGIRDKLYADAMAMASAYYTLKRAGNQAHPLRAQELLPTLEHENGMEPLSTDTESERRRALYLKRRTIMGGGLGTINQALNDLLGNKLIGYRTVRADELYNPFIGSSLPAGTYDSLFRSGSNLVDPETKVRVIRNRYDITTVGVPVSEPVEYVAGDNSRVYQIGQKVLVDAGTDRAEVVTVQSEVDGEVMTTFTKPHNAGALWTSQQYPLRWSEKRKHLVFVTMAAAADWNTRKLINDLMRLHVKGTAVWEIMGTNALPSQSGPFRIGVSGLGVVAFGSTLSGALDTAL